MSIEQTQAVMDRYWSGHDGTAIADDAVFSDIATGQQWSGRQAVGEMLDHQYSQVFDAEFVPQ